MPWLAPQAFLVLVGLFALVYLPGLSGPFVFDDYTNLLDNTYVQVTSLRISELDRAAFSLQAGPLRRPVSMLTFALNYYWAGDFETTWPFKAVNLALHILNGLLIYWFGYLALSAAAGLQKGRQRLTLLRSDNAHLYAGAVALLWVAHPIQLTSVLYVVQRMTELAGLFLILALICYFKLRSDKNRGAAGRGLLALGLISSGVLAALSKENGLLLPVFIIILEFTLFADAWPWRRWLKLTRLQRRIGIAIAIVAAVGLAVAAVRVALPGYAIRDFDMVERLMTEGRVLLFYLGLILVPRIDQFALLHDDILISRSLLDPWTTLPSLIGIAVLLAVGLMSRRRRPMISLGILWFLGAHLLESTVFPLEIAHEHRNYIASWGLLLAFVGVVDMATVRTARRSLLALIPLLLAVSVSITLLRAMQWSDANELYRYEAAHHPQSPGAQAGLASLLSVQGDYPGAESALHRASQLDPREPAYLLGLYMISAKRGIDLDSRDHQEILRRLKSYRMSATTSLTLDSINRCMLDACKMLLPRMEDWMNAVLSTNPPTSDASYFYYLLGRALYGQHRINESIKAFAASYDYDQMYLFPLFELAGIYLETGNLRGADVLLAKIRDVNRRSPHPRSEDLKRLEAALAEARKTQG